MQTAAMARMATYSHGRRYTVPSTPHAAAAASMETTIMAMDLTDGARARPGAVPAPWRPTSTPTGLRPGLCADPRLTDRRG